MKWKIPLFKTYSDKNDVKSVAKIINRGTFWAVGPEIEEFEKKIARYVGSKYALTFNSGTSALHALLVAHDVKGKEVIVPSMTFVSTATTILLAGGIPVFSEMERDTFGIDVEDVKKRITKKTKAIIPIHYAGYPARDIVKLRKLAKDKKILLIEDAAESLGARIGKKMVGTYGDSGMFSFCQNKIISTGEGGLIVTNSREIYEKSKLIRSHGRLELEEDFFSTTKDNDYIEIGYNYRMPTMLAALGMSQLSKIQKVIDMRRKNADYLTKHLSKIGGIEFLHRLPNHYQVHWVFTIILKNEKTREGLKDYLASKGIMSKVYYAPVHLKTIYKGYGYKKGDLPFTEKLTKRILTIPFYPHMKKKEMNYLIKSIKDYFKKGGGK